MNHRLTTWIVLPALVLVGCATNTGSKPNTDLSQSASNRILASDPTAFIGQVTDTLPSDSLASVSSYAGSFPPDNSTLVITDAKLTPLATAMVVRNFQGELHVRYTPVKNPKSSAPRAPARGDIVIRLSE